MENAILIMSLKIQRLYYPEDFVATVIRIKETGSELEKEALSLIGE